MFQGSGQRDCEAPVTAAASQTLVHNLYNVHPLLRWNVSEIKQSCLLQSPLWDSICEKKLYEIKIIMLACSDNDSDQLCSHIVLMKVIVKQF